MARAHSDSRTAHRDRRRAEVQAAFVAVEPERWRDKHGIAEHFACGVRWIEARMVEGMPHTYIAGRAKFRVSEVEAWLEQSGFIERGGRAAV